MYEVGSPSYPTVLAAFGYALLPPRTSTLPSASWMWPAQKKSSGVGMTWNLPVVGS